MTEVLDRSQHLGLHGTPIDARIEGIGGKISKYSTIPANLYAASAFTADVEEAQALQHIEVVVIKDPITRGPAIDWKRADKEDVPYFHSLEFPTMRDPKVELLIGQNYQPLLRGHREVWCPEGVKGPDMKLTALGWTATGSVKYVLSNARPHVGAGQYHQVALNTRSSISKPKSDDVTSK